MHSDDERRGYPIDKLKHHIAGGSAKKPEFMLQPNDIRGARVNALCSVSKALRISFGDRGSNRTNEADFDWATRQSVHIHREIGVCSPQRSTNIGGKSGDPATPGGKTTDQDKPVDIPGSCRRVGAEFTVIVYN
ncbi:MAG: hypothetical protein ABIS10_11945 [Novosphingobium sp.]